MPEPAQLILVRHGETEWSVERKHTGRTDVPLTDDGRDDARAIAGALRTFPIRRCFASPLSRAWETAQLGGLDPIRDDDLVEWDYGDYEGRTTDEIRRTVPGWSVWTHPMVGGESVEAGGRSGGSGDRAGARPRWCDGARRAFPLPAHPRRPVVGAAGGGGSPVHARHDVDVGARLGARESHDRPVERSLRVGSTGPATGRMRGPDERAG